MVGQGEKQPDRELLKIEYQECVSASRFLVGTRFNYFASFTTLFLVLIGGFYYILSDKEKVDSNLKSWLLLAIAMFGLHVIGTVLILEKRVIQLYRSADNRAAELERLMGIRNGIRQIFASSKKVQHFFGIPLTHTFGIATFYKVIFVIWLFAVFFSIYQILTTLLH